jgi:subtilisin family serine protease
MSTLRLALAAGLCIGLGVSNVWAQESKPEQPAPAQPGTKKVVKTADDLPRHTYKIEGKASEFVLSDAPFKAFVSKVKADTEADLAQYQIEDRTTLQGYYGTLQQIAMFEGRFDDAIGFVERIRELEAKESKKLMTGQVLTAMVNAGKSAGGIKPEDAKFREAFKAQLDKQVRGLPWDKVKEEVNSAKGRAELISRELVLGSLQGQLDPVVAQQNGEVSGDLVKSLVGMRVGLDKILPLNPSVAEVYGKIAADNEKNKVAARDIWAPSQVKLTEADHGTPVVIGIWDSGVDAACFKGSMWTNKAEVEGNNKDDDNNGFVDDVHGIAYDLEANKVSPLLGDLSPLRHDRAVMQRYNKGFTDVTSNVDSEDATAVKKYISSLKRDEVTPFTEDLTLFGGFCHGTHVAGIAAEGNPYARILGARITFDHRAIPTITPNLEQARREAQAAHDTVAYFRKAGVRVVNMSWGGSREGIEQDLEKKGVGKSPEERASLSRELFKIQRDALEAAMKSAPEILFIAAAGNSDNDNEFSELLPSGLKLANMITVGAIDSSGKPTGFTTFGKNVTLYANGFEVDSYIPGGEKQKFSGTSMAAPNAANLAGKLLALDPKLTTQQVIELITQGAEPMEGQEGRFIINPKKSIEMLKSRRD